MSRASRIRGILFDKDGTLIDFDATWVAVARKMALRAAAGDAVLAGQLLGLSGFDEATGRFLPDSLFASGTNADVVALWHPHLAAGELARTVASYDAVSAEEGAASAVVLPGIRDAVARLHDDGYRLAMATNDSTLGAEKTLVALGFAHKFAAAYGYDAVARPKPAPDVVIAFADMSGLSVSEIAMVGDNRHDLETGRAAGAGLVVGVLSGTGTRETLAPLADVVIGSVADLPDLLAGRG